MAKLILIFFTLLSATSHAQTTGGCAGILVKKYQSLKEISDTTLATKFIATILTGMKDLVDTKYAHRVVLLLIENGAVQVETIEGVPTGSVRIAGQALSFSPETFLEAVQKFADKSKFKLAKVSETELLRQVLKLPNVFRMSDHANFSYGFGRFVDGSYTGVGGGLQKNISTDAHYGDEDNGFH